MLLRTSSGVQLLNDWWPARIGQARVRPPAVTGEGMAHLQALILRKPAARLPAPIPVPVLDNVEKLARFLNG